MPEWDNRQLGLVVRDLDKTLAFYASLDMGQTTVRHFSVAERRHAEPFNMEMKVGFSLGGSVQTEIIEPGQTALAHSAALANRGEGGHYIGLFVSDLADEVEKWEKAGVEPISMGCAPNGTQFAYMDTARQGGVTFKFVQVPPDLSPRLDEVPQLGLKLNQLRHVGVVVWDMDKTIDFYSSLGMGPFTVAVREYVQSSGKTGIPPMRIKLAFSENCLLPIELIQPLSKGTFYHDTLERQGEGIHHGGCWVANLAKELARLEHLGIRPLMGSERGAFINTQQVGGLMTEMIEFRHLPESLRDFPTALVGSDLIKVE